jgi:DNA-binding PadR family transcriptional regulator
MTAREIPGEFDRRVLVTIRQLADSAYAPDIAHELERDSGRTVSRGALYTALDRLEQHGLVRWSIEEATEERGGLPKRRFEIAASYAGSEVRQ